MWAVHPFSFLSCSLGVHPSRSHQSHAHTMSPPMRKSLRAIQHITLVPKGAGPRKPNIGSPNMVASFAHKAKLATYANLLEHPCSAGGRKPCQFTQMLVPAHRFMRHGQNIRPLVDLLGFRLKSGRPRPQGLVGQVVHTNGRLAVSILAVMKLKLFHEISRERTDDQHQCLFPT
jgi:hypothetical protein